MKSHYREKELIRLNRQKRIANRLAKMRAGKQILICVILMMSISALAGRVLYIKVVHGESYERSAIQNAINSRGNNLVLVPDRGNILTRDGQVLASSIPIYDIALDVEMLNRDTSTSTEETLDTLVELLDLDKATLLSYFEKDANGELLRQRNFWQIIARGVSQAKEKEIKDIKHVYSEKRSRRVYPHNSLAASTIGFIRGDSSWGLERKYNDSLAGVEGRQFSVYDNNERVITQQVNPKDGYSIITTIDLAIQQYSEDIVKRGFEQFECDSTAILVMNPKTGEVLSMAQYPSVNLNDPMNIQMVSSQSFIDQMKNLSDQETMDRLFGIQRNFNVSSTYQPGSIFKPIVVAAAIEENIISRNEIFHCGGSKVVADRVLRCWNRTGHGNLNTLAVLAQSCNVGMFDIIERMGRETFHKYRQDFGFGHLTGIDLPGEASASESSGLMYSLSGLNPVELATSSMGQGFNVTTIQAVNAFASTINGGRLMKPYVVSQVIDRNKNIIFENEPVLLRKVISESTSNFLREGMKEVVSPAGTGKNAIIQGYNIGGKTGTGQQGVYEDGIKTISFIGYFPVEDPQIIAIALLENANDDSIEGSTSAAPMLRELMLNIINYKNIQPSGDISDLDGITIDGLDKVIEDYVGLGLAEATRKINSLGIDFNIIGDGDIVDTQTIGAGERVGSDSKIFLYAVDRGGVLVTVPNLTGMPIEDAIMISEAAGLSYFVEEVAESGSVEDDEIETGFYDVEVGRYITDSNVRKVLEQNPSPNIRVQQGTQIKLKVK